MAKHDLHDWEKISEKVYRQWRFDRRLVVYKLLDSSRETVDTWVKSVIDVLKEVPTTQPFLAIYDVSDVLALTPYARKRSMDIVTAAQHHQGAYALVLSNAIVSNVMRLFVRREIDPTNRRFVSQFFHRDSEAQTWISQWLEL